MVNKGDKETESEIKNVLDRDILVEMPFKISNFLVVV